MTGAFSKIDEAAVDIVNAIYGPVAYPDAADRDRLTLSIMRAHGVHPDLKTLVLHRVIAHFESRLLRMYENADQVSASGEAA